MVEKICYTASCMYRRGGVRKMIAYILSRINRVIFSCDIPPQVYISKNTSLRHQGLGVVIHPKAIIGENNVIRQHVSIGTNAKPGEGGLAPKIGNNVMIGAGACILGNISIGNNVVIGANAVVLIDIPDDCIAVGIPAKIIKHRNFNTSYNK